MSQSFHVDRRAMVGIIGLGALALPLASLFAAIQLSLSAFSEQQHLELIPAAGIAFVGLTFLALTVRELRSAIGIRITPEGIKTRQTGMLTWSQLKSFEEVEFGIVMLRGENLEIRICTYLFESREKLMRLFQKHLTKIESHVDEHAGASDSHQRH